MPRYLAILALALSFLLGAGPAEAGNPPSIRIGFAAIGVDGRQFAAFSAFAVAHVRGLVEQELAGTGVAVEWHFYKGAGPAVNEAIAAQQLDFAIQGDLPSIIGRAAGLRTRLLLAEGVQAQSYIAVPADSPIKTVADLKGRTVAYFKGTAGELPVARILATAGLTERDVRLVNLDMGSGQAALATHQVDAAFTTFYAFALRDQGLVRLIYSTKGQAPTLGLQSSLLVTDAFAEAYPALVDHVVRAAVAAAQWASDEANRDALFQLWAKSGVPEAHFAEDFQGDALRTRNSPLLDPFVVTHYKTAVADARRFGLIRGDVDVDQWTDRRPLDAALKALHLEGNWPELDPDGNPVATR
jgi:sulfonate transport system substrate-binding protein